MISDWGPRAQAYMAGLHAGCVGDPIYPPAHDYGCWHLGYWHGFCHRNAQERAAYRRGGDREVVRYRHGLAGAKRNQPKRSPPLTAK